jgi:hypothetical protein
MLSLEQFGGEGLAVRALTLRRYHSHGVRDRLCERDHPKHVLSQPDWAAECSLTGAWYRVPEDEAAQQVPAARPTIQETTRVQMSQAGIC